MIHIFEDEWFEKQQIIKSIIIQKTQKSLCETIYARKCKIQYVDNITSSRFLEENHLQGPCKAKYNIGLFFNNQLVQLMTIGKPRYEKIQNNQWEIYRLCTKTFTNVIGGTQRLFAFFIKQFNPDTVISYSDNRYFTGKTYEYLGFKFVQYTQPNYFYVDSKQDCTKRLNRLNFQKHKLKNILKTFDENLTESENMHLNGYGKIWDCGTTKWKWSKN